MSFPLFGHAYVQAVIPEIRLSNRLQKCPVAADACDNIGFIVVVNDAKSVFFCKVFQFFAVTGHFNIHVRWQKNLNLTDKGENDCDSCHNHSPLCLLSLDFSAI